MKFKFFFLGILISLLSCQKKEDTSRLEEATLLFEKSGELIISYTEQIKEASDSVAVDSLYKTYEKRITDVNFSVSPQTDLFLSEQENDSLYRLQQTLNLAKNNRLNQLKIIQMSDSIQ